MREEKDTHIKDKARAFSIWKGIVGARISFMEACARVWAMVKKRDSGVFGGY